MMKPEEKKQGLKEILLNLQKVNFNIYSLDLTYTSPQDTINATKKIEKYWSEISPEIPEKFELTKLLLKVKKIWNLYRNFERFKRPVFNKIPWLLFFGESPHLASNSEFISTYLKVIRRKNNPSSITALINVYLSKYQILSPVIENIRQELVYLLKNNNSPRLKKWKDRTDTFKLLEKNAHKIFADALMKKDVDIDIFLCESGFKGQLLVSGFLGTVHSSLLEICFNKLKDQTATPSYISKIFFFLENSMNELRFPVQKVDIVKSLLLPFKDGKDPTPEIQKQIVKFISQHFDDPISNKSKWQIFGEHAREVMLRWNVHKTLNSFFKLIDTTAQESHWKHRKKFWMTYYKKGYISDAWIVLGKDASNKASDNFAKENLSYGSLSSGTRNQSVLLFKVASMTVCEWSHNGSCRIWLSNNTSAPKLYQTWYKKNEMFAKPINFTQKHMNSEGGNWQKKIAEYIESEVGIRLSPQDYLLSYRNTKKYY